MNNTVRVSFRSLPYFKDRYPRYPDRLTRGEALESIYSMIFDASALGLDTTDLSALRLRFELSPNMGVSRTAYEAARGILFRQLNELDPEQWQLRTLDPNGGFRYLTPFRAVHKQEPNRVGVERVTVIEPDTIGQAEIDYAKKRLAGVPAGVAGNSLRLAALEPLLYALLAAGNGPAAIVVWLKREGFRSFISGKLRSRPSTWWKFLCS